MSLTKCPSQSEWFRRFMQGARMRMGKETNAQKALPIQATVAVLDRIKRVAPTKPKSVRHQLWKVGAAIATAQVCSLRGPEVLLLDLAGLREHIHMGRRGTIPHNPVSMGTDLADVPYIFVTLLGEFKGERGIKHHIICVPPCTRSGIQLRWWLEKLVQVR